MSDYNGHSWTAELTDAHGNVWVFQYNGGSTIRIRPADAREGEWTHGISLGYEGMTPGDVTGTWLTERTVQWIADRENDPAEIRTVA